MLQPVTIHSSLFVIIPRRIPLIAFNKRLHLIIFCLPLFLLRHNHEPLTVNHKCSTFLPVSLTTIPTMNYSNQSTLHSPFPYILLDSISALYPLFTAYLLNINITITQQSHDSHVCTATFRHRYLLHTTSCIYVDHRLRHHLVLCEIFVQILGDLTVVFLLLARHSSSEHGSALASFVGSSRSESLASLSPET